MKKILLSTLLFLCAFLTTNNTVFAADFGFKDDFSDGSSTEWQESSPAGSWAVNNQEYIGTVTLNHPEQPSTTIRGDRTWENYKFSVDIKGIQGVDKTILFRINQESRAYAVNLRSPYFAGGNDIILFRRDVVGGVGSQIMTAKRITSFPNQTYHLDIFVENVDLGTSIIVKVDGVEIINYLDSFDPIVTGAVGFEIWPGGYKTPISGLVTTTIYDNISVEPITSSGGQTLNIPDLKQYDPRWGGNIYNNHTSSVHNISRWGCLLTSLSMILQSKSYDINPGTLNDALKVAGGFHSSHILLWDKFTKYVHQIANGKPSFEYKRYNFDPQILASEIKAGRPAIVKLTRLNPITHNLEDHFVLAKGIDGSDFLINDPASSKSHLSQYSSEYIRSRVDSLIPSHTDLSSLVVITSPEVIVSLLDQQGNQASDVISDIENPFVDIVNSRDSEPRHAIRYTRYPKPKKGTYKIVLSGPAGVYNAQVYSYNASAQEKETIITGVLGKGSNDEIIQVVGDNPSTTIKVTIDTTLKDLEGLYSQGYIKDKKVYLTLKSELIGISNLQKIKLVYKTTLKLYLNKLKSLTPRYITKEASLILQEDISQLLKS